MFHLKALIGILCTATTVTQEIKNRPNIVIIMADDMGFDDISFRGSNRFLTPNIDALAYSGVLLKNLYVPAMCTPSRSALLTGKYPINTGMNHYVIANDQPWGLPTNETTMAQIFQQNGYYTSLIGKWHLGMSKLSYTPTKRGFDHHYGYLGAYIDYYDHTLDATDKNYSRGHDFRNNLEITRKSVGTYATELFTEEAANLIERHNTTEKPLFLLLNHLAPHAANEDNPLQAPAEEVAKFSYIKDKDHRIYAAMMSELDKSVAQVITALRKKSILNNTIIVFLSDNGGPTFGLHSTTASNYPLRGQKNSPWEGGIRSSASIWSAQFEKLGTVWKQQIYIADLLPTLAAAAGISLDANLRLDGLNLWSTLKYGYESVEREIVHNIDDIFEYYSYMKGKWKLVQGSTENGTYDGWYGTRPDEEIDYRSANYEDVIRNTSVWQELNEFNADHSRINITSLRLEAKVVCQYNDTNIGITCNPLNETCLFDIESDPCEQNNLFVQYMSSKFVQEMLDRVSYFRTHAHMPNNKPTDPHCDPKYYNYEWTWWEDGGKVSGASSIISSHILKTVFELLLKFLIVLK